MKTKSQLLAVVAATLSTVAFGQQFQPVPPIPPVPPKPGMAPPQDAQGNKRVFLYSGEKDQQPQPFLGLVTSDVQPALSAQLGLPEGFGLLVEEVLPDSPAATAGVQKYDILKSFNDQQLINPDQLATLVRATGKDKEVSLTLLRKGQEQHLTAKVSERPMPSHKASLFLDYNKAVSADGAPQPKIRGKSGDVLYWDEQALRDEKKKLMDIEVQTKDLQMKAQEQALRAQKEAEAVQSRIREQLDRAKIPPADIFRQAKPDGGAQIKRFTDSGVTVLDGSKAHLMLQDNDGEIEVTEENGHRTLKARNRDGKEVFSGPVDTEEQRQSIPEPVRKKLDQIKMHSNEISVQSASKSKGPAEQGDKEPQQ